MEHISYVTLFFYIESRTFLIFVAFIELLIPNSYMEEVYVRVIYNTLLDSNEEDLSTHALQTIYIFNINENKISDRMWNYYH